MERTKMPKDLCKAMKLWDKGLIALPEQYNYFQMKLADQEIYRLKTLGFMEVEGTKKFYNEFMGIMIRVIKMVKKDEVYNLKWNTFNQGFLRDTGNGAFSFDVEKRNVPFKEPSITPIQLKGIL